MNWLSKKLSVSINRSLVNKNDKGGSFDKGFEPAEVTAVELAKLIKQGFAYAPQMEGGVRNSSNFIFSSVLSADFDGEVTPEEIGKHPLVQEGATIIYTTASHSRQVPRFRIIFALEDMIEDPKAFRAANQALALQLGSDPSAVDAGRMFYGNTNAQIKTYDRGLSAKTVEALIKLRYNAPGWEPPTERVGEGRPSTRSDFVFSPDLPVLTAYGSVLPLREIEAPASLHCPFHNDKHPSAYLVKSRSGQKGIHCSKCAMTYWPIWEPINQTSFVDAAKRALDFSIRYEDRGPLAQFEHEVLSDGTLLPADDNVDMIPGLQKARVMLLRDRYFPEDFPITQGMTYIKSPKGTGKRRFSANW